MSNLNFEQFMIMSEIVDTIGIDVIKNDDDITEQYKKAHMIEDEKEKKAKLKAVQATMGMRIIFKLFSKIYTAQEPLLRLISNCNGITVEEAKKLNIKEIVKFINLVKDDFMGFFSKGKDLTK